MNNFKSVPSRKVRKEFEVELRQFYWDWSKGFWSDGYSVDSVGFAPLEILKKYVQNQGEDCLSPLRSDSQAFHPDSLPVRVRAGILSLRG
ncbi:MAG: transposase [Waterburya sp.]